MERSRPMVHNPSIHSLGRDRKRALDADLAGIQSLLGTNAAKLVVLDDDPTGTQTVHDVEVVTEWSVETLAAALQSPGNSFFVLTNSRSLAEEDAVHVVTEVVMNLKTAAALTGMRFTVVNRGDSTLRGHYPAEIDAIVNAMGVPFDAICIVPAFFEAGRVTIEGMHYTTNGNQLVPVAETEFARDTVFGYHSSFLPDWVAEKSKGKIKAEDVATLSIDCLRRGSAAVCEKLCTLPPACTLVVDSRHYGDMAAFVEGLLLAEAQGRRYVFRTAASFVRIRAGIESTDALPAVALCDPAGRGGFVVVGSYVAKTTTQLELLLSLPGVTGIELRVAELAQEGSRAAEIDRVADAMLACQRADGVAVVYTTRNLKSPIGEAGNLAAARLVSAALVATVRRILSRPRYFIAKGGITSSDLAVHGFGVRQATILGQAIQGVPVWKFGPAARFGGMPYVVFPGNVGSDQALMTMITNLSHKAGHS